MKDSIYLKCPKCGKIIDTVVHVDAMVQIMCWMEDGGCGNPFFITPIISDWHYMDNQGYDTGKSTRIPLQDLNK